MAQQFSASDYPALRYFIGDVRDADAAARGRSRASTIVIHAAALKQVPAAEYNPFECIKTNVHRRGERDRGRLDTGVERVVALSTDKAAARSTSTARPSSCSDKLFVAANNIAGGATLAFRVVRYGNVMGCRGSVIPFFLARRRPGRAADHRPGA